jgi:hypothetical protein
MNGIFIRPEGSGFIVVRADLNGTFPLDWFRHKTQARIFGRRSALQFKLVLFEELPLAGR